MDGVLIAVDQDDVCPTVVIDVAGEGRGGPRAPQRRTAFRGEAVPSPVVEVAVHRHVGAPARLVGEHHLRQRVVGEAGGVHPPRAVRLQRHRVGEPPAPAGKRRRVHRERLRGPLLADHQVAHPAAAQVGQRHVAGPMGGHGQASGLREATGAAPIQPTALLAVLEVPAREGQIDPAVAVEVSGRHRQGVAAREPQRPAEAALPGDRHQELRRPAGDEHQRFGAEVDGDRQRRHGTYALRLGELLGLGKVGRCPSVGSRHVRPALRVDAASAAPVDPRRPVCRGHDQLRVAVPVQVGRAELHAFDRGIDVLLRFDAQVGLMEQPHPTLGQQGQVRAAIAVEVAGGHRRTAVRRQHGLVAFAQAGGRSEVHVGVQAAGVAALLVADDQVGVAVAADVGHRRRGAAAGRQLGALAGAEDVAVHAGRRRLQMDLRVAEQQVHVAVAIQVQVVDALQHPGPRNVEVLAGVAEGAAPKRLESRLTQTPSFIMAIPKATAYSLRMRRD